MKCEFDANGGIQTADHWGWQWPLYQTRHHPCPHNLLKNLKQNHESAFPIIWWLFKSWKPGRNPLNNLQVCIYKSFLKSLVVTWVVKLYLLKLSQLKYPVLNTEDKFEWIEFDFTTKDLFQKLAFLSFSILACKLFLGLTPGPEFWDIESIWHQILRTLVSFEEQMFFNQCVPAHL